MTRRINRCSHCGCDEPILGMDGKLYCDNCGMSLEKLKGVPTMPENKMPQVAALFGKDLGEEFTAVIWDEMQKCKFTYEGLKVKYLDGDWHKSDNWLRCLLIGEAKIVED